ncbi:MAG: TIGR03032 family protein, partial [Planctomycetota bacterium]
MPTGSSDASTAPLSAAAPPSAAVEARYEASGNLALLLERLGVSLVASTYQAGKLLVLGTHGGELSVSFNNFDRAMGL